MPLNYIQNLLDVLRRRDVADIVRKMYTGVNESRVHAPEGENAADVSSPTTTMPGRDALELGHLFTLKADLTYVGPDGFGEWQIFTTARARVEIEDMKATDGRSFDGMLKKLWYAPNIKICVILNVSSCSELSHGRFSPVNHKPLTNKSSVDIYRARLPGDLRIVVCASSLIKLSIPPQVWRSIKSIALSSPKTVFGWFLSQYTSYGADLIL
jgi:hypothetical protein